MAKRHKELRLPTDREISLMLTVAGHPRDQLIITLGWKLGLRASEISDLQIDDIDWSARAISFVGKGGKEAILPLTDEVLGYLERALAKWPANHTHGALIWNTRCDSGISRFAIYYLVHGYGQKIGIKVWPHLLRHKFGTDVFRKTGDIYKTKEALRHSRLETTDRYTHTGIEDRRESLDLLDTRNWSQRLLSKLKPTIPQFLVKKPPPSFKGETVGRNAELARLSRNAKAGVHTVLCGQRGVGKSHLLNQLTDAEYYRLEDVRPPREKLISLGNQMVRRGVLPSVPKGRGTSEVLEAIKAGVGRDRSVLVVDSLSDVTRDGISLLQKLKERFTIVAAIDRRQRSKLKEIFYGSQDVIELHNLPRQEAYQLAEAASADLRVSVADRKLVLRRMVAESNGNPQAIMEIIEKERRWNRNLEATTELSYEGGEEPQPATPFLTVFLLIALASRFAATSVGMPDWKLIAIASIVVFAVLGLVDRILRHGSRP